MYTYIKSPYWKHWTISLLLLLATGFVMQSVSCFKVHNLIQIEFANTASRLLELMAPYISSGCNVLYCNTLLDFGFLFFYSMAFYYSGKIICDLLELTTRKWLILLFVPMLFDVAENLLLLHIMEHDATNLTFTGFYYAVRIKWLMVIPCVLLLVTVMLYQLYVAGDKIYCRVVE